MFLQDGPCHTYTLRSYVCQGTEERSAASPSHIPPQSAMALPLTRTQKTASPRR